MLRTSLALCTMLAGASFAVAQPATRYTQPRDTMPDTWVGADDLGRSLPTADDVGPRRSGHFVAMFYFTWLGAHGPDQVFDITKILAANGDRPPSAAAFGPRGAFHWWGEPHFGYYRSDDRWIIRKHAQLLADAGVDVIVCDVTNAFTYDDTVQAIFETYAEIRAHGGRTPAIAFIAHAHEVETVKRLYDRWYKPGRFRELWFQWKGKPLIMADPAGMPAEIGDFFTFRRSWAFTGAAERKSGGWFGDGRDRWPWIDNYPQSFGWHEAPDKPEAMSVAIATHPIAGVGRSHDGRTQPPVEHADANRGTYFQKQWDRALAVGPELIFVTGWNEWVAQRFEWGKPACVGFVGYLRPKEGDSYFVDQYTQEFSRDAEPMRGGHGDNYYCQLVANIRRFKGVRPPVARGSFVNDTRLTSWADVPEMYLDDVGDVAHRDSPGFAKGTRLSDDAGRNDIDRAKVALNEDASAIAFYLRCVGPIVQPDGENRLWLLIDADGRTETGLGGFEILVNRRGGDDVSMSVERIDAGAERVGSVLPDARCQVSGDELCVTIPLTTLGIEATRRIGFNFKWIDHLPFTNGGTTRPSAMAFYDVGDSAPNGRWAYRFDAAQVR